MSTAPFSSSFAHTIYKSRYAHPGEEWDETAERVVDNVLAAADQENSPEAEKLKRLIKDRKFIPGGRYLYASGRDLHQTQNCLLLKATDTREGWSKLVHDSTMALMTGAGIGVWYGDVRCNGSVITRTGGIASGPISLMKMVNEVGRNVMQGGARRSAIWAGLPWWHPDVFDFIRAKDWSQEVRDLKDKDFTFPADLDMTNISVTLDKSFFSAYEDAEFGRTVYSWLGTDAPDGSTWHDWAHRVYDLVIDKMLTTAEPGFSVDYEDSSECLRNACTEITSSDDSDVCNLGSLNLSAFSNVEEFGEAVRLGTLFLIAGTIYSDLPYEDVYATREKNRRLGLGLMGVHEWLLARGKRYGPDDELAEWLAVYRDQSDAAAAEYARALGVSEPVKKRAIAPNGTIGILAETTTSAEPIFAAAYKRRVRNASASGDSVEFEYVVDPTAARLVESGVHPSLIEDSYELALDYERRIAFQAWLQQFVDHGISSTINLPHVVTDKQEQREFGEVLMQYLPQLRGITAYPDGCRGGQPLTSVPLEYALDKIGVRYEEDESRCVGGLCGV